MVSFDFHITLKTQYYFQFHFAGEKAADQRLNGGTPPTARSLKTELGHPNRSLKIESGHPDIRSLKTELGHPHVRPPKTELDHLKVRSLKTELGLLRGNCIKFIFELNLLCYSG